MVYVQKKKQRSKQFYFLLHLIVSRVMSGLLNLDANLAKVLLVPLELISLLELLKRKHLLVDNGLDVVGLDRSIHLLKLLSAAHVDTANGANVDKCIEESRLLVAGATNETDDGDNAFEADGLE